METSLRFAKAYIYSAFFTPFLCTFIIELACNNDFAEMEMGYLLLEIILCALIEFILVGLLPMRAIGLSLCYVASLLFGMANFYLLKFRDIPFMLMDLKSFGTAMNVADGYDFSPSVNVVMAAVVAVFMIGIVQACFGSFRKHYSKFFRRKITLSICACSGAVMFFLIGFVGFSGTFDITMDLWRPGRTYAQNGALTSFVTFAQFSDIEEPEDYDKEKVAEILSKAEKEYDKKYGKQSKSPIKPTVISIMNEAFSDLSVMGPLECTDDHLVFFNSLKDDPGTIWHGYTYVSTYAGGTARTEFEWLTGYSMRMFSNAQPFSQFDFEDIATLVDDYNEEGYKSVAMHPELAGNYRRNTAYEQMGFDDFLSIEDYKGYDRVDFLPGRVSDEGDYDRLIDEDESIQGPLFIHNVTIQNHGGYEFKLSRDKAVPVDEEYRSFPDFYKYESLVALSDGALEDLINYYRESDEPVIICFYGDHLPGMSDEFNMKISVEGYDEDLSQIENEERRFQVPCFIWANYDVENPIEGTYYNDELITSNNYLGIVTKADAGLTLSAFDKYMLLLREEIPVINESAYFTVEDGWHSAHDDSPYQKKLWEYSCVQYAGMFDIEGLEEYF